MVFLLLSAGVPAQAGTGFTLQPVKVSHTLAPGDSVSEMITLINESDEDVNLDIAVEDFVPTAGTTDISSLSVCLPIPFSKRPPPPPPPPPCRRRRPPNPAVTSASFFSPVPESM